jgi:short-subunit dehydrogenase
MGMVIFITGAASGIGEALSLRYAREGVTLGLLSRDAKSRLEEVAQVCRAKGAVVHAAGEFMGLAGRIDIVVANAGVAIVEYEEEGRMLEAATANIDVNYYGVINTFAPFLDRLREQRSGSLVAISSNSALRATHNSGPYSASKAAVVLWTEGLRLRLRPYGVTVTTICPGFVDTAMTKVNKFWMPGMISAEKAARLIGRHIDRRSRVAVLPWTSGGLWLAFSWMPGRFYDWLIDTAKRRMT